MFEFVTAGRILFGPGAMDQAGTLAAELGHKVLIASGRPSQDTSALTKRLQNTGMEAVLFPVRGEPTIELVHEATELARAEHCDLLIGFGGGSAIDTAKATAALLANGGEPLDYLEVIGKGKPITRASTPWIAIPTTAGTGAEVTRNAVLGSHQYAVKVSLRSPFMLPRVALVDPELTLSVPPAVTASTGMDTLAQLIEPFVSVRANPFTDAFCREGMQRVARSLRKAYQHGDDRNAREDMALASLWGGLALANAGLGAVHGFAGPIGGMYSAPHGAVCAKLLSPVMAMNVQALRERNPGSSVLKRYDEVAQLLTGRPSAIASDGVTWVQELCRALAIAPLSAYGLSGNDLPDLVVKSIPASSMQANPIKLTPDEMRAVLAEALV